MKRTIVVFSMLALASGCGSDALSDDDRAAVIQDDSLAADDAAGTADGMCVRRHQSCVVGGERCCTGFCATSGYYGYGYGKGTCSAFLLDGSYCTGASECKSKVCTDYQCVAAEVTTTPACGVVHAACTTSADCCGGSCDQQVYSLSYHTCIAAQADGSYCTENRACQSNACNNYRCVAAACIDDGKECAASSGCCSGYCEMGYITGTCAAPQANNSYCRADSECKSGHCTKYVCAN